MKYRTLGKTGEKVSILGFGAMRLPHFETNAQIDKEKSDEILSYGIVFTSQGTPFLQLGTEMMRSKELPEGMTQNDKVVCSPENGKCFNQDSYNASSKINAIDFKAGERVYVGNRLSPESHPPAEPTA